MLDTQELLDYAGHFLQRYIKMIGDVEVEDVLSRMQ